MARKESEQMNHYTYLTTRLSDGLMYVGCRTCKCDILVDPYLGSPRDEVLLKEFKENPGNFKKDIIAVHDTRAEAIEMEIYIHNLFDVGRNPNFLNRAKQTSTGFDVTGNKHSKETIAKISAAGMGNTYSTGEKHPNYGKHLKESTCLDIAKTKYAEKNYNYLHNLVIEDILNMKREGLSNRQIAKIYGVSHSTINNRIKIKGI